MALNHPKMLQESSIESDELNYEIFSILESKFLFGHDDHQKVCVPRPTETEPDSASLPDSESLAEEIDDERGTVCILSIDGGGMRGVLSGKSLAYLEESLKIKSSNPNATIADYFDVAAGTGIGGIFTAMLFSTKEQNRPIFQAADTWKFLVDHGKRCYNQASKSSFTKGEGSFIRRLLRTGSLGSSGSTTSGLEKALKELFPESLTLKSTLKPVLIPCYDLSSSAPFLFSRADAFESDSFNFRLSEVCQATSSEPGLFQPVTMKSVNGKTKCVAIDGGLAMSNPTAAAITHVLHNKQEFPFVRGVEDLLVLSLGTGQLLEVNYDYAHVKKWKPKQWARPVARISGDGSADMVDHAVAMAFGQYNSSNYVRIQANGSNLGRFGTNLDTDDPKNVKMLVNLADDMLKQKNVESVLFGGKKICEQSNYEKLDWFATKLVSEHQRRSCRLTPTVAFKQAPSSSNAIDPPRLNNTNTR